MHKHTPSIKLAIATLLIVVAACADEKVVSRSYPVVNSYDVTDINEQGATFNGEILSLADGVTNHGFIYGPGDVNVTTVSDFDSVSLGAAGKTGKFSTLANRNLEKGKTYYVRAFAIAASGKIVLGQQVSFVSKGGAPPKIDDFNPKQGSVGDTVVIVGSSFSSHVAFDEVSLNNALATVVKASTDSLWVVVPSLASISDSTISLKVGGQKAVAAGKFKLLKMTVSSFEPSLVTYGDTVTIHGMNLPWDATMVQVSVLQKQAIVVSTTRTKIKVLLVDASVSSSPVSVNAGIQSVKLQGPIKLQTPVVTSFTPMKGGDNAIVTLTGKYFNPDKTQNKVTFAGATLEVSDATQKTLKVKIPTGIAGGFYPFSVATLDLTSTSSAKFEIAKPFITDVAPLNGTWGTTITLTGDNFGLNPADNLVTFNSTPATVVTASPTQLTVQVPLALSDPAGTISVTVNGSSTTFQTPFVLDKPEITSFSPEEGKQGTVITIIGKTFIRQRRKTQ